MRVKLMYSILEWHIVQNHLVLAAYSALNKNDIGQILYSVWGVFPKYNSERDGTPYGKKPQAIEPVIFQVH